MYQLDVKSAFLNGVLDEEIYVEQPQGFVKKEGEDNVYIEESFIWVKSKHLKHGIDKLMLTLTSKDSKEVHVSQHCISRLEVRMIF